jgi:hypothetical protein
MYAFLLKKLKIINLILAEDYEKMLMNLKISVNKQTTGWLA